MNSVIANIKKYGAFALPLLVPVFASAAGITAPPQGIPAVSINSITDVSTSLVTVADWMFYFLIILTVIFVMVGAYKYLTAAGDPEKVKSANQTLLYAAIAVVVALFARAFPAIVASIFG